MSDALEDTDGDAVEHIHVEPRGIQATDPPSSVADETALVTLDGSVRLDVDRADLDRFDNLTLYRDGDPVAHASVHGVPLEVPTLIHRAIENGEQGAWE